MAYIDKDLLLKDIGESVVFTVKSGFISPELRGARKIIDRIENAPTADVVEVKHGEWLKIVKDIGKGRTLTHYKCSLCGVYVSDKTNYCYYCGAKMDGERRDE